MYRTSQGANESVNSMFGWVEGMVARVTTSVEIDEGHGAAERLAGERG
jgi:hypothetical protein